MKYNILQSSDILEVPFDDANIFDNIPRITPDIPKVTFSIRRLSKKKSFKLNLHENVILPSKLRLIEAIKKNDYMSILNLLNNKDIINETDKNGLTALHYACFSDEKIDILCSLLTLRHTLKCGSNLNEITIYCNRNIKDNYGRTPILVATLNKCIKAVEILCNDIYVDNNAQDNEGNTALHIACLEKCKSYEIVGMLLDNTKSKSYNYVIANKKNIYNDTPIMLTLEYNDTEMWNLFFEKMDIINMNLYNLLKIFDLNFFKKLLRFNNIDFLKYMNKKIDPIKFSKILNVTDENKMKIIHFAINDISDINIQIIKFLLKNGSIISDTIGYVNTNNKFINRMSTKINKKIGKMINISLLLNKLFVNNNKSNNIKKIKIKSEDWLKKIMEYSDEHELIKIIKCR